MEIKNVIKAQYEDFNLAKLCYAYFNCVRKKDDWWKQIQNKKEEGSGLNNRYKTDMEILDLGDINLLDNYYTMLWHCEVLSVMIWQMVENMEIKAIMKFNFDGINISFNVEKRTITLEK